jgi:mono/diheme cytochrome c family protein
VLDLVRTGVGVMPRYDDKLDASQIEAVAAFVARVAGAQ